jgi:hypothetical protein
MVSRGCVRKINDCACVNFLQNTVVNALVQLCESRTTDARVCACQLLLLLAFVYMQWEGPWSDAASIDGQESLRHKYDAEISKHFPSGASESNSIDHMDGQFFMSWADWCTNFTHLFVGIDFVEGVTAAAMEGRLMRGKWDLGSGGNRQVLCCCWS